MPQCIIGSTTSAYLLVSYEYLVASALPNIGVTMPMQGVLYCMHPLKRIS